MTGLNPYEDDWEQQPNVPAVMPPEIEPMSEITKSIRHQIYKAIQHLHGDMDILATVGSWGDSLPDDDVLHFLEQWNKRRKRIGC